jgi:prepilin-type processing-associated H-X9-DG protein
MGCRVYANDSFDWFPHHYYQTVPEPQGTPPEHGVRWVGAMGSNDFLRISQDSTVSPRRNHPSRALFLLVTGGNNTTKQFICPSSAAEEDDLRNRGPDAAASGGQVMASQPGINRFDFRGYSYLSYGYQLPYGPRARPNEMLDPRVVVLADKGPYYRSGGEGLAGSGTMRDERSAAGPPTGTEVEELLKRSNEQWRPHNSRNHYGEGQNVLFVDGHTSFERRPVVGVNHDNIYTIQGGFDAAAVMTGLVPDAEQALGPLTNTDSFVVP